MCYTMRKSAGLDAIDGVHALSPLPAGINAIVAIMTYGGYNQEDSVLFNQSAIDRGFFRSMFYRSFYSKEERDRTDNKSMNQRFENPAALKGGQRAVGLRQGTYAKLDEDGLARVGEAVGPNDVLIGKTKPAISVLAESSRADLEKKKDESTCMRPTEAGVVDRVMLSTDRDGNRCAKVRIRNIRILQVEDKFASRHGRRNDWHGLQAGGHAVHAGWHCADIIVNPHAFQAA